MLESWDWADIQGKQPLFTSPFGDVFFQAQDGFWFLDLLEGTLARPWSDADALQAELNTAAGQDRYLMAGLAFAAERQGIIPSARQVLSFKVARASRGIAMGPGPGWFTSLCRVARSLARVPVRPGPAPPRSPDVCVDRLRRRGGWFVDSVRQETEGQFGPEGPTAS